MSGQASTNQVNAIQTPVQKEETPIVRTPWWQIVFIYPSLGIAVISAVPTWIDAWTQARTAIQNDNQGYETTPLVQFMQKNPDCVKTPYQWVEADDGIKIDGTICSKTGDVWLTVQTPTTHIYKGIEITSLMKQSKQDQSSWLSNFDISAHATPMATQSMQSYSATAFVVCQRFSGSKIIRHVRTGNACFDEQIDSHTGVVESRTATACRTSC